MSAAFVRDPWFLPKSAITPASLPHGYRSSVAYDSNTKAWITVGQMARTFLPTTASTGVPLPLHLMTLPMPIKTGMPSPFHSSSAAMAESGSSIPRYWLHDGAHGCLQCRIIGKSLAVVLPAGCCCR